MGAGGGGGRGAGSRRRPLGVFSMDFSITGAKDIVRYTEDFVAL